MVERWAKDMVERVCGGSPFEIGDIVTHKKHGQVKIVSGKYWGTYGISNFWNWKKVLPDGSLSKKTYHGYGTYDIFENPDKSGN